MNSNLQGTVRKSVRAPFIIAGVQVAIALLLVLAGTLGMIDTETLKRGVMVLIGLSIAVGGNRIPKALDGPPPQSIAFAVVQQAVNRVGGSAMLLAGLVFAGLWAFAPTDFAFTDGVVAIGAAIAVVFIYFGWRSYALRRASHS